MHIGKDEKQQIAQILSFFLSGEKLAHRCAKRQARMCDDIDMRRFFITQSRQEKFHAAVFQSAIMWLAPKGIRCPAQKQMKNYEKILIDATRSDDLSSSIIGLQVILEGMGEVALSHFNNGICQRGLGYEKIRNAILIQEDRHHEFGLHYIETNKIALQQYNQENIYLSLIEDIFTSLEPLFEFFSEDSNDYLSEFHHNLPVWMQNNAIGYHPNP